MKRLHLKHPEIVQEAATCQQSALLLEPMRQTASYGLKVRFRVSRRTEKGHQATVGESVVLDRRRPATTGPPSTRIGRP
jgi:hypothetical protein